MKKIDNNSDTDEDLDKSGRKKPRTDVKDQIVPLSDTKSFEQVDDYLELERKDKSEAISDESCQDVPENVEKVNVDCELDVISSLESYNDVQSPQCFDPIGVTDSCRDANNQENYVKCSVKNTDEEPYDPEDSLQSYEADYLPDNYVTEDSSSLPVSESMCIQREENEGLSFDPLPLPAETTAEAAGQEEEEKGENPINRVYSPVGNNESESEAMSSSMTYLANVKESDTEAEEVRCNSRGGTVLVMSHDVFPADFELAKSNPCVNEELTYRDHLNSIERVDGIVFHSRNSVIDTSSTNATGYPRECTNLKYREEQLICDEPVRESEVMSHCAELYSKEYVECRIPKRVFNGVQMPVVGEKSSEAEMFMYNASVQDMVICRSGSGSDCENNTIPVNVNGLHAYSFHRVSPECCSNVNNVEQSFNGQSPNLCSFVQNADYEDRGIKIVRKLPSDEDFMRRIEKTLFESKIESRDGDIMESKYKSELDLSLPFKKRLRTLYSEKFISPKVDSFPSYCAKPMINIAELEGLLPQGTKSYQENHK